MHWPSLYIDIYMHCSNNKMYKCKANNFQARLWQALVEWPCRDSQRDDTHSDHPCTLQFQIKSDIVGIDFAIQLEDHFQQATQIQVWSKTVQKQTRLGQKSFFPHSQQPLLLMCTFQRYLTSQHIRSRDTHAPNQAHEMSTGIHIRNNAPSSWRTHSLTPL